MLAAKTMNTRSLKNKMQTTCVLEYSELLNLRPVVAQGHKVVCSILTRENEILIFPFPHPDKEAHR